MWKERDPDGVVTLYGYNSMGDREYVALDLNQDDAIDIYGPDRVTKTERTYVEATGGKPDLIRTDTIAWTTEDSVTVQKILSRMEVSADGLKTWHTVYPDSSTEVVTRSQTEVPGSGNGWKRIVTRIAADDSTVVSIYDKGRLISTTRFDSDSIQIASSAQVYDPHGRVASSTDARNGTTSYGYNAADQITSVALPSSGILADPVQTTLTHYNIMLQVTNVVQADGGSITNEYHPTGLLKKAYGSRTYPVEYTYDYAGRMKTMKTWQNFAGNSGAAITTWNYDVYRGWLTSKDYPDATTGAAGTVGPDYSYTGAGRLSLRQWARTGTGGQRIRTVYKYGFDDALSGNQHGDLTEVSYVYDPQNTPAITYTHDRLGRQKTVLHNGITTTLSHNDSGQLLGEAFSGGILDNLSLTNGYDEFLRRTNLAVLNNNTRFVHHAYAYDAASRFDTVTDHTTGTPHSAQYAYLANSTLVDTVTFKQNTTTRMTTTRQYDKLNRLLVIASTPSGPGQASISYAYTYNSANQRTRATLAEGSYWRYEYDALGQVKSGRKYFSDGTLVPGQQFDYSHDDIGNRISAAGGGDENGWNLRNSDYTRNRLNQYTQRTVPGYLDAKGVALAAAGVTVNGLSTYRKGEYFWKELTVANGSAPVWQSVAIAATGETTANRNAFVSQTPEAFSYDLDGNMTGDGRWTLTWDAENRLVKAESYSGAPTASKRKVEWTYDYKGRRIRQTTSTGTSGSYVVTEDLKFLSDPASVGRHVAELNYSDNALRRSYVWGLDLSGRLDSAGGVGGLLMVNSAANGVHFSAYDGNGNVTGLVKGADGTVSAIYEYDPFGQTLRATGPMADENRFQFSTKRSDLNTGYILYEYRVYHPSTGRWLNRDPIEEQGGNNLLSLAANNPISMIDPLGLKLFERPCFLVNSVRSKWSYAGPYPSSDWAPGGSSTGSGTSSSVDFVYTRRIIMFYNCSCDPAKKGKTKLRKIDYAYVVNVTPPGGEIFWLTPPTGPVGVPDVISIILDELIGDMLFPVPFNPTGDDLAKLAAKTLPDSSVMGDLVKDTGVPQQRCWW